MKVLVLLAIVGACVAAEVQKADDQKADETLLALTYAAQPLTYTAGYPYSYGAYSAPYVYNNAYAHPLAYNGYSAYHPYSPLLHSLKKRDTAAAEDQKGEDATVALTYAVNPLTYTAGYPYSYGAYSAPYVYNNAYAHPLAYNGYSAYHPYSPLLHSLKKRDTAAAEDQKGEEATVALTYAAHPLTYTGGYPYAHPGVYSAPYVYKFNTPASTAPLGYATLPYSYAPALY